MHKCRSFGGKQGKEKFNVGQNNTVGHALPGASIGLGCNFMPARKLLDAGAQCNCPSDWNLVCPNGNLLIQAAILGTFEKLTQCEVSRRYYYRAARSPNLEGSWLGIETGTLWPNLIAFPTCNYKRNTVHQVCLLPSFVWKKEDWQ